MQYLCVHNYFDCVEYSKLLGGVGEPTRATSMRLVGKGELFIAELAWVKYFDLSRMATVSGSSAPPPPILLIYLI